MELLPFVPLAGVAGQLAGAAHSTVADAASSFSALLNRAGSESAPAGSQQPEPLGATPTGRYRQQRELALKLSGLSGGAVDLEELRFEAQQAVESLQDRIATRLSQAGISPDQSFSLRMADSGELVVGRDHPEAAAIEDALAADEPLASSLVQLLSTLDLLQTADAHRPFAGSYEDNPLGALAEFSHLFAGQQASLELLYTNAGLWPSG